MSNPVPDEVEAAFDDVLSAMRAEFKRAVEKHTLARTPANPLMSDGERLKILVEEVGEVARAMTYDEGSTENLLAELVQVATMAVASAVGIRAHLQTEGV
jgi:predicted HAD superfamily Cof-like phosphohydrolase